MGFHRMDKGVNDRGKKRPIWQRSKHIRNQANVVRNKEVRTISSGFAGLTAHNGHRNIYSNFEPVPQVVGTTTSFLAHFDRRFFEEDRMDRTGAPDGQQFADIHDRTAADRDDLRE